MTTTHKIDAEAYEYAIAATEAGIYYYELLQGKMNGGELPSREDMRDVSNAFLNWRDLARKALELHQAAQGGNDGP